MTRRRSYALHSRTSVTSTASTGPVGGSSRYCGYFSQQRERALELLAGVEDAGAAAQADPPEAAPVLLVVVDEDRHVRPGAGVLDPAQPP